MRKHLRGSKKSQFIDPDFIHPDFAEALYEGKSSSASSRRQEERKTRQFCHQVQQALNLAFADRSVLDGITGLFVEDVSPAPDCGRLLVHVLIPDGSPVADMMTALSREAPRLRSEVAAAITRKRAPELTFVPVYEGGGDHD